MTAKSVAIAVNVLFSTDAEWTFAQKGRVA
jgi:hypothetical protein